MKASNTINKSITANNPERPITGLSGVQGNIQFSEGEGFYHNGGTIFFFSFAKFYLPTPIASSAGGLGYATWRSYSGSDLAGAQFSITTNTTDPWWTMRADLINSLNNTTVNGLRKLTRA